VIATLLIGLSALVAQAPPTTDAARLKTAFEQAKRCGDATVGGNYETLADLTNPAIVKAAGGRETMIKQVGESMAKMKAQGVSLDSMKAEAPETLYRSGTSVYCVVPMIVTVTAPGNKITSKGFLLGVSDDDGANWSFADGSPGEEKIRALLPGIPPDVKFPAKERPKVEPNGAGK